MLFSNCIVASWFNFSCFSFSLRPISRASTFFCCDSKSSCFIALLFSSTLTTASLSCINFFFSLILVMISSVKDFSWASRCCCSFAIPPSAANFCSIEDSSTSICLAWDWLKLFWMYSSSPIPRNLSVPTVFASSNWRSKVLDFWRSCSISFWRSSNNIS